MGLYVGMLMAMTVAGCASSGELCRRGLQLQLGQSKIIEVTGRVAKTPPEPDLNMFVMGRWATPSLK
jgi:hypothetical protein